MSSDLSAPGFVSAPVLPVAALSVDIAIARGTRSIVARFDAASGITALFGPSGAGKTSMLDAIAGLVRPERGRIVAGGQVVFDAVADVDLVPERRGCGYVFQDARLFPHLSVSDNLLYGHTLATRSRAPARRAIMTPADAIDFLGIRPLLKRMPRTLSGGEAQRVAIGRALLAGPRVLLLDEPLASLDRARRDEIMGVIERLRDELALPMIYVSHDRAEIERLADQVIEIG